MSSPQEQKQQKQQSSDIKKKKKFDAMVKKCEQRITEFAERWHY